MPPLFQIQNGSFVIGEYCNSVVPTKQSQTQEPLLVLNVINTHILVWDYKENTLYPPKFQCMKGVIESRDADASMISFVPSQPLEPSQPRGLK